MTPKITEAYAIITIVDGVEGVPAVKGTGVNGLDSIIPLMTWRAEFAPGLERQAADMVKDGRLPNAKLVRFTNREDLKEY